jgi:hypothetical protein
MRREIGNSTVSCPVNECRVNMGGYCSIYSRARFNPGVAMVYSPDTSVLGFPNFSQNGPYLGYVVRDGEPAFDGEWQDWRDCPYVRAAQRKR